MPLITYWRPDLEAHLIQHIDLLLMYKSCVEDPMSRMLKIDGVIQTMQIGTVHRPAMFAAYCQGSKDGQRHPLVAVMVPNPLYRNEQTLASIKVPRESEKWRAYSTECVFINVWCQSTSSSTFGASAVADSKELKEWRIATPSLTKSSKVNKLTDLDLGKKLRTGSAHHGR